MLLRIVVFLFLLLFPLQAHGHKIHVFAWVSGDTITVESGFTGNHPLVNGSVTVINKENGELLLRGTGDKRGIFTFSIPPEIKQKKADLVITVAGGEGHQSQWTILADEYQQSQIDSLASTSQGSSISNHELKRIIEEVLTKELAPIKRSLAKAEDSKPDFRDIMGGIGYLLGLAGLVAWLKNRHPAAP